MLCLFDHTAVGILIKERRQLACHAAFGLGSLLAVHEPRFVATMNDLTTFQVSLLRAILEGNTRFSSAEVIRQYGLNSSANVRRLKDALCKKEIVFFDGNDNPVLLDPLFEYWVRRSYFKMDIG